MDCAKVLSGSRGGLLEKTTYKEELSIFIEMKALFDAECRVC